MLVSRDRRSLDEMGGYRVGVDGVPTTGWFLLRWLCPDAIPVAMAYDRIAAAVTAGELDAGVMIHEELTYYPKLGLQRVADLGAEWCRRTGVPLPLGLNVVRRNLGRHTLKHICTTIRRSLEYGLAHRQEARAWASRFGHGRASHRARQFEEMVVNDDAAHVPKMSVRVCGCCSLEAADRDLTASVPQLDIIEGTHISTAAAHKSA